MGSHYCPSSLATTWGRYVSEPWIKADEASITGVLSSDTDGYLDDENLFFEYTTTNGISEVQGSVGKISYDKAHFGKWAICPGEASIDDADSCYSLQCLSIHQGCPLHWTSTMLHQRT